MKKNAAIKVTTQSIDGNKVYECSDRFIIGKSGSADLAIDMEFVSRRHLFVCKENDSIQLVDLNSANGTYVNNKKIDPNVPYSYKKGDIVYLGNKRLVLKIEEIKTNNASSLLPNEPSFIKETTNSSQTKKLEGMEEDPDLAFLNDNTPSILDLGNNTSTQLQKIQEQKMQLMQAEAERKIQAEFQQKMLEANEKSLVFINQAKQNAHRIIMEAKNQAQKIVENANDKAKNIYADANAKISQMNVEIQSFEKETKLKAEHKADEIVQKAEDKASNLLNSMSASLEKQRQEKNLEIQKAEDQIKEYKKSILNLENQKREKEDLLRKVTTDVNIAKDQLSHTDLLLDKYKIQLKELEAEHKKISNEKEHLIREHEKRKFDFDNYLHTEEAKLQQESTRIRTEVEKLFLEKQSLHESVDTLSNRKNSLDRDIALLQEIKTKEDSSRNEKKAELDKLQNSIEILTQKKFELIKETDRSLAGVREDAIKNRNEAIKLLENAKIKDNEINQKIQEQENRFKILINEIKSREEKANIELNNLNIQIEKAKVASTNIATDIINNAKSESKKISDKALETSLSKQKDADIYYSKKITEADTLLTNARLELQKIEEQIKQKNIDAKSTTDAYISNSKARADKEIEKHREESTKAASELLENAKIKSTNLIESAKEQATTALDMAKKQATALVEKANNAYNEKMKNIEMNTVAKMAFEEEESKKRIEQYLKREEALKSQRVKEVYRNIKDVIVGRLNSNAGKTISPNLTHQIQEDLQNIIKIAFGYKINEGESVKGILFSGNLSKKVKLFYLKIALSIFIPILLLTVHLVAPDFYSNLGKGIISMLTTEESASDIFIKQMMEARKNKPKYLPPLSAHYKPTYTDNILFTEGFIDTVTNPVFQKEWVIELNKFIVNELGLSENAIVSFISKETRLIYELFEQRTKIKPENAKRDIEKMKALEVQYEADLITILGDSKDNFRRFATFRQSFYEKFKVGK